MLIKHFAADWETCSTPSPRYNSELAESGFRATINSREVTVKISGLTIIAQPELRKETAINLATGASVFVAAENSENLPSPAMYSASVKSQIKAGQAIVGRVQLDDSMSRHFNIAGMQIGGTTGLVAGAAIGVLLDQLRTVHPASAVAFDAACALLGAATGVAVGSGQFEVEGKLENGCPGFTVRSSAKPA